MNIEMIRKLLKTEISKGKKQIVLANEIGISHATIYKLLNTNTKPTTETLRKIATYFKVSVSSFLEAEDSRSPGDEAQNQKVRKIPVISKLHDRLPDAVRDEATNYLWLEDVYEHERIRIMVATEDAMAPLIKKGDYVLFRTDEEVKEGEVAVAEDEWMDLIVRRVKKKKGKLFLVGENPEYPPVSYESVRIVGRAEETISRRKI